MEVMNETLEADLQALVKNNRQSIEIYNEAANLVNNTPMSILFDRLRQQRLYFENILERILEEQGGKVEEEFNLEVLARKVWLDIRNLLVYRNEYDILSEVKKVETKLKEKIEDFLQHNNLHGDDLKIVRTQLKVISNDLRNIEKMQAEYSDKLKLDY